MKVPPPHRLVVWFLAASISLSAADTAPAQTLNWGVGGAGGSGTWSTSVANWSNGTSTVPWSNGSAAVFGGTAGNVSISGSVTASQATFGTAGYIVQNGFLNGVSGGLTIQTDADATILSSIFGASPGNTTFTKAGEGVLLVNNFGAPALFGAINVAAGELRYGSSVTTSVGTPYTLGNAAGAALTFSNSFAYVGSLAGGGANGGVVRPAVTSGNATFTMNGVGNTSYAGTFQSNGTTFALRKFGNGTQTLTGHSFLSGSTVVVSGGTLALAGADGALSSPSNITVNNGGTFQLDNSAVVNQTRLDSGQAVTLNGGTFNFVGNAGSQDVHQTVGALNVASGASTVSVTTPGSGTAQLIFSNGLARTAGATVAFTGGGHIDLGGNGNPNVILGGYATVGADWATQNGGTVVAFTNYGIDTTAASNGDNLRVVPPSPSVSLAGVQARNSLNLVSVSPATATTVDLGANNSLTLASGGLLTSGAGGFNLVNGKISSGTGELIVTNQSALTITSVIGSALTKTGAGTLILTGANVSGGTTTVNQGTLQVSSDANLGTGGALVLNGGTLQTTGSFTSTKGLQGTGGTLDTAGNNVTFDSQNGSTASFTKTGAGVLTLTRQNGSVVVNGGTLRLTNLVGGNATAVTLNSGRLEAGVNGLGSVTTAGGSGVILSPGQVGQAESFVVNNLTLFGTTTMDFDVGSPSQTGSDFLSVEFNLTLGGLPGTQLLFRFNNLGGVQTGTSYSLARLPSSQLGQFSVASFGIDPASTAAGYRGTLSLTNGTVSIVFTNVPEPSTWALLAVGVLGMGSAVSHHRRTRSRVP